MSDEDLALDQQADLESVDEQLSEDDEEMARLKEAVVINKEEIGALRLKVGVTVPRELLDERMVEQFDELRREADIPGFRKGHAPLKLVEKRFGNDVGDQLKGQLISRAFLAGAEKEGFETLGDPLFWVNVPKKGGEEDHSEMLMAFDEALEHIALPQEGDFSFTCEVEIKPEIELPDLQNIAVNRKALTVSDEDVESEIKRLLTFMGTFKPVEDGQVESEDMIYADVVGVAEGEEFYREENEDFPARDTRVSDIPLDGFGDAVNGKKVGDVVKLDVTLPDDHNNMALRGKQGEFTFTLKEIKRLEIPELNDDVVAQVGLDSVDEFRSNVKESLEGRLDSAATDDMYEQIGDYLVSNTSFELPEGLSNRQVQRSLERRRMKMVQQGFPPSEIEEHIDEIRDKAKDQVARDLKLHFILEKIAETENVEVKDEEFNAAIAQIAARSNKRFDRVMNCISPVN